MKYINKEIINDEMAEIVDCVRDTSEIIQEILTDEYKSTENKKIEVIDYIKNAYETIKEVVEEYNKIPAIIDTEIGEGVWQINIENHLCSCSNCGWTNIIKNENSMNSFLYCPYCGTTMSLKNKKFIQRFRESIFFSNEENCIEEKDKDVPYDGFYDDDYKVNDGEIQDVIGFSFFDLGKENYNDD